MIQIRTETKDELQLRITAAKAEQHEHEARFSKALADTALLAAERDRLNHELDMADDASSRVFRFINPMIEATCAEAIDTISRWDRVDSARGDTDRPYTMIITSPGGDVSFGLGLYSFIRDLRRPTIGVVSGMCASMAAVLIQAFDLRLIQPGSLFLIHDISSRSAGGLSDLRDQVDFLNELNHELHTLLAERSTLTVEQIHEKSRRRDWMMLPAEAIELGFVDQLTTAKRKEVNE